jgi:uncharacterized protein (DUF1778 family)
MAKPKYVMVRISARAYRLMRLASALTGGPLEESLERDLPPGGTLRIRITAEAYRLARATVALTGESLTDFVSRAVIEATRRKIGLVMGDGEYGADPDEN